MSAVPPVRVSSKYQVVIPRGVREQHAAERGAVGDAAWRDGSGQLVTRDLDIPLDILTATAGRLLGEFEQLIRRLVAGLSMPDWPEGARRAITVSLSPVVDVAEMTKARLDGMLDRVREADGLTFEYEGD